jgi:homocysteine S-methyltransferase
MPDHGKTLPQLRGGAFLTDGGLETTLIFREGHDLPHFAAFPLVQTPEGESVLRDYFRTYAVLAVKYGAGLILESVTWRANRDWGQKLGYDARNLAEVNRRAIRLLEEVRAEFATDRAPIVISGCIGPRGDGYVPRALMTAGEAEQYHRAQVEVLAETACDLVSAFTMNYVEEAIGVAHAARMANIPVVISFTVETDGRLPSGQALGDAIRQVDDDTSGYPAYYMLNCAHPSHIMAAVRDREPWTVRLRGLRVNASRMSHAELNDAPALDDGDPVELGHECASLVSGPLGSVNVLGGCCGTDHRHVKQIAAACLGGTRARRAG